MKGETNGKVPVCARVVLNSRVIQQQDNRVELLPGSVISSERHNKVIEAVPRSLGRHDDELVFETVSLGILEAVVPATLRMGSRKQRSGGHFGGRTDEGSWHFE